MRGSGSACLVLNGKSASREDVRAAVRAVRDEGADLEVRVTWEAGDAERFAREAAEEGVGLVVAGGGDGTINQVAIGLVKRRNADATAPSPSLGVLPLGTANDFAHSCGIPLEPLAALRLAVGAADARVDVGRANDRFFVNVATGGFGTQVTVATPPELKKLLGGAAYFLTGLTHFSAIRPEKGRFGRGLFLGRRVSRPRRRQRPTGRRRPPALPGGPPRRRPPGRGDPSGRAPGGAPVRAPRAPPPRARVTASPGRRGSTDAARDRDGARASDQPRRRAPVTHAVLLRGPAARAVDAPARGLSAAELVDPRRHAFFGFRRNTTGASAGASKAVADRGSESNRPKTEALDWKCFSSALMRF
jgi:hypothetical protein